MTAVRAGIYVGRMQLCRWNMVVNTTLRSVLQYQHCISRLTQPGTQRRRTQA